MRSAFKQCPICGRMISAGRDRCTEPCAPLAVDEYDSLRDVHLREALQLEREADAHGPGPCESCAVPDAQNHILSNRRGAVHLRFLAERSLERMPRG